MSEQEPPSPVENSVNQLFATFERAQNSASIDNVYGKPIPYSDKVIIPIASVSQFFGVGMGVGVDENSAGQRDEGVGGGGSGKVGARPVALAEVSADGVVIHPIVDENRALIVSLAFAAWAVLWTARTLAKIFK